jgi:hypothetical protein
MEQIDAMNQSVPIPQQPSQDMQQEKHKPIPDIVATTEIISFRSNLSMITCHGKVSTH